ncbi:hypothetical protein GR138_04035 [Shinella kummerowiae]|uniref:Uncharacterized protein n=1 Tax=Shinella kummerowiae TaxID=417745 RepID=A0A6N8S7G6_9HYPH|nr:hypothetical protein [Shinella kummerowiae]MXN44347.1 hypothetical protein [Shinella kummerowiae]
MRDIFKAEFSLWIQTKVRLEFHHFSAHPASNGLNFRGFAMTCIADHGPVEALKFREPSLWHKLSLVFRRRARQRLPRLDPKELSDHMKRDLGFLEGRGC